MGCSFRSKSCPTSTVLSAHRSMPKLLFGPLNNWIWSMLWEAVHGSSTPHLSSVSWWWEPRRLCKGLASNIINYCKVNLNVQFFIWRHFHIFPVVYFKHYYYSTTANSLCSAGRPQGCSTQMKWHTGSMRKPCEQVRVFVQVCAQANTLTWARQKTSLCSCSQHHPHHICCLCITALPGLMSP